MLSLALALAVITSPADAPTELPCSVSALHAVALTLELMDPREVRYLNGDDVHLLRYRYAEVKDAPAACDAKRFPDRDYLNDCIAFNGLYKDFLEQRYPLTHEAWILDAVSECDRLYQVYDTARDAKCGYYYLTVRRAALQRLRDSIGPDLYYMGCLPACIPTHYLRSIN